MTSYRSTVRVLLLMAALVAACGAGCSSSSWGKRKDEKAKKPAKASTQPDQAAAAGKVEASAADRPANAWELPETPAELQRVEVIPCSVILLNKEPITVEDIIEPILPYLREAGGKQSGSDFEVLKYNMIRREIIDQQDYILLYQEYGRQVKEEEAKHIEKFVAKEIKDRVNKEFGGREARYEKYLERLGLSIERIAEKRKRRVIVIKNLQDEFKALVRPPRRKELVDYYEKNKSRFESPTEVEFFAIEAAFADFFPTSADRTGELAQKEAHTAAREYIQQVKDELDGGMEFEAVARRYGRGFLKYRDGLWGTIRAPISQARWRKASEAAFKLKSGQISDIIEGPEGFYVVKCGKRTEGRVVSFEDAQSQLNKHFERSQYDELIRRKKMRLRARADRRGDARGLFMKILERLGPLLEEQEPES